MPNELDVKAVERLLAEALRSPVQPPSPTKMFLSKCPAPAELRAIRFGEAPFKVDGCEVRRYYLTTFVELILTTMCANTSQRVHLHKHVSELMYVSTGQVDAWLYDRFAGKTRRSYSAGDVFIFPPGLPHVLTTCTGCELVTVKFVNTGEDHTMLFKSDWIDPTIPEQVRLDLRAALE